MYQPNFPSIRRCAASILFEIVRETSLSGRPLSYLLFLDDFTIQETDVLKEKVTCLTDVVWCGLRNTIGKVADAGIALILKILVEKEHRSWLGENDNPY